MSPPVKTMALVRHPSSPSPAVRRLDAGPERLAGGVLAMRFGLEGDLRRIRIPPASPPRIVNGLWQHTCFEVFVGIADEGAYHEWNLSPSGEWAAHAFRSYRDGGTLTDESLDPAITVEVARERLELVAAIPLHRLSPRHADAPWRVGLSAVIEAADGTRSWWALRHVRGEPDFHHADAFALRLEPPGA